MPECGCFVGNCIPYIFSFPCSWQYAGRLLATASSISKSTHVPLFHLLRLAFFCCKDGHFYFILFLNNNEDDINSEFLYVLYYHNDFTFSHYLCCLLHNVATFEIHQKAKHWKAPQYGKQKANQYFVNCLHSFCGNLPSNKRHVTGSSFLSELLVLTRKNPYCLRCKNFSVS